VWQLWGTGHEERGQGRKTAPPAGLFTKTKNSGGERSRKGGKKKIVGGLTERPSPRGNTAKRSLEERAELVVKVGPGVVARVNKKKGKKADLPGRGKPQQGTRPAHVGKRKFSPKTKRRTGNATLGYLKAGGAEGAGEGGGVSLSSVEGLVVKRPVRLG